MEQTKQEKSELSEEEKREIYLVYHRKAYDKDRDKILAIKKANYVPTGRGVGRPRKERVVIKT